jgi:ABC-type Fe3+/spermidine/putrescine transport system ATPase subunit
MMLVLAPPAAALDRSVEGGEAKRFKAVPAQSRQSSLVPQNVALDPKDIELEEDPSAPRLFGSLPVAENVAVGVGLFSVLGTTEKEQIRRRMDPAREMLGSSGTRVAAVGLSLRF